MEKISGNEYFVKNDTEVWMRFLHHTAIREVRYLIIDRKGVRQDETDRARKTAKYVAKALTEYEAGENSKWSKEIEVVAADSAPESDIPHLGDIKDLIERGVITDKESIGKVTAFATNASDLNFRPDNWPSFTLMLGPEKITFRPIRDIGDGGKVYHSGGDLELYVFND